MPAKVTWNKRLPMKQRQELEHPNRPNTEEEDDNEIYYTIENEQGVHEEVPDMIPSETVVYTQEEWEVKKILKAVEINGFRQFLVEWEPTWVHQDFISQECKNNLWDQNITPTVKNRRKKRSGNRHHKRANIDKSNQ